MGTKWILPPVIYRSDDSDKHPVLHLQWISGVHFNPVGSKHDKYRTALVIQQNISSVRFTHEGNRHQVKLNEDVNLKVLISSIQVQKICVHQLLMRSGCVISDGQIKFCELIEKGAKVSLLSGGEYKLLKDQDC